MKKISITALTFMFFQNVASAQTMAGQCESSTHNLRSKEIQEIVHADQEDRKVLPLPADVILRDQKRRMRIGEIFGEGCIQSANDFSAAALVYQHGNVSEHFFQTFLWAKRATELGDSTQKRLMSFGIDRYLVSINKKQLFASQAYSMNGGCWCLQPVEQSFPDNKRIEYTGRTLADSFKWINELNKGTACAPAIECSSALVPSPSGTVPGFW